MSNLSSIRSGARPGLPTPPNGDVIASYRTYAEAQRGVDHLADQNFPVQFVTIVGVDLQMVERVTGRLTYARVALAGLASGAWFGLFVGLLLSFVSSDTVGWLAAVPLGAAFGMAFGLISYALTGGRRDFTSTSQIVASEYRVLCQGEHAGGAMNLLRQLDSGSSAGYPAAGPPGGYVAPPPGLGAGPPTVDGHPPSGQPTPPPTGPTYSEMIDRKRREEREAAERAQAEQGGRERE